LGGGAKVLELIRALLTLVILAGCSAAALAAGTPDPLSGGNSMDAASTLETLAEIGVALAGFAGIVGALAGEKLRPTYPEIWLPFWAMIASGLVLVLAALFPFLPYRFGAAQNLTWAASSAFVAGLTACNLAYFMPRILRAIRDGAFPRVWAVSVPLDLASLLVLATQVLNALGIGFRQSAGGFLLGLYLLLLISGLNFVFLLYVLGRTHDRP
jgi:hypothetical protein